MAGSTTQYFAAAWASSALLP